MPTTLSFTYDLLSTDPAVQAISQLRLWLGDTDLSAVGAPPRSAIFADQELSFFLSQEGGDLVLAACDALLALANDRARLHSFAQLQGGGSIDLRGAAAELRAQEQEMREKYYSTPAESYSESNWNDFAWRRLLWTQSLRAAVVTTPVGP